MQELRNAGFEIPSASIGRAFELGTASSRIPWPRYAVSDGLLVPKYAISRKESYSKQL
jgi:hypothetical protein